jgi:three-Cys-motif partner protein
MADFFASQQAAAVLKHAIYRRYLPVFIGKTGSKSLDQRVVVLDGYAGPGMYRDGTPGSPELAVRTALTLAQMRNVECLFVERNARSHAALHAHLKRIAPSGGWATYHGYVEKHLDELLAKAAGLPMFAFFDPYGMTLPFTMLTGQVLARSGGPGPGARAGWRRAPTEVLLNFSVPAIERQAGLLHSTTTNARAVQKRRTTLARLDAFLGGDWWRSLWQPNHPSPDRVAQIVDGYRELLARAAGGWSSWTVPVADRWGANPVYYLLFLTQHADGMWEFGMALSSATEEYYQHCHAGQLGLDPLERRETRWVEALVRNLDRLLAEGKPFTAGQRMADVFGETLGYAREKHLREALKHLYGEGKTLTDPRGPLQNKPILPARARYR